MCPQNSETAKKAYEALTAATRETFPRRNMGALTKAIDGEKLHAWIVQRVTELRPGKPNKEIAGRLANELYWSFIDLQIALCHVLFVYDTGDVHPGVNEVQVNTIELPKLSTVDGLFWFYVSVAWEHVYRVWSRLENLLNFLIFGVEGKPTKDVPTHLDGILTRIKMEQPDLAATREFTAMEGLAADRNQVAGERNKDSHIESSPFASLDHTIEMSEIFQASGDPSFKLHLKFPLAKDVERKLIEAYYKVDKPWGTSTMKLIDAACRLARTKREPTSR